MLQLVLGRAGSGKTEYVFSSIKKLIDSGESNLLLITPEQFSFVAERRLLTDLGEEKVNEVENASFSRLAGEITRLYGGDSLPILSKGAKAVMMKKAIESVQDSLVLFHRNITSNAFINSVISIYDEMKSCRVSVDDIYLASENSEKELLSQKLKDIAAIIGAYDALIENEYFDAANELTRLYHKLLSLDYFKDRIVFVDGFSGFVAQEYKILEVILKQAKAVYITFCTDSYINHDKYDLFSYVNTNIAILREVTKKAGVRFMNPISLGDNRRAENDELRAAEKYVFSNIAQEQCYEPEHISLYSARNINDECDYVSAQISKLLRNGYRASDISVICRDLEKYSREMNFSFNKYHIPYFDDERQEITSQPIIMFVSFLLRTAIYSYRSEDIFSLLKTGLTALSDDSISSLENYVFLWNISGSKWKREFTESTKGFAEEISEKDKKQIDEINQTREYIVTRLNRFFKRCKDGTPSDICKAIYYALIDFSADEQLKALAVDLDKNGKSALGKEQGRIWDLLMEVLDKLALVGGDSQISLKEFYKLFTLMVTSEDIGSVPIGLDNVQLGSADRIRCDNPRAVFIVGANEGEFPQNVTSSGLLSENDRIALINNDFKLYSYGETLNAQERYFAYMAVSAPRERLYVSYRSGNEQNSESSIVRGIKAVFPNIQTKTYSDTITLDMLESEDNAFDILASNYSDGSEIISSLERYFESNPDYSSRLKAVKNLTANEDIKLKDTELSVQLFHKNMYLSASRIEDYYNCAFRYFCKFGIGARPRQRAQMDPMQTGTVIHYVLEQIIREKGSKGLSDLTSAEIAILVNTHLDDYLHTKMGDAEHFTPRFKYQFMRLSKMLICVVERLKAEFSQSDFEAKAFELRIGNGSDGESVKSKKIMLPDGGSVEIKGAIDRVDVYEENGRQYVRVVDYKSGTKEFQLSDILSGLNLQMFIYLFTLCQSDSEWAGISSGVLYMHSSRKLFSLDRCTDDSKVQAEENKLFKMKGVVLNDEENEIAKHMEKDLRGKYIPARFVKKNQAVTGNIVTLEELGRISRKIDALIEEMGASLHSGVITQNPIDGRHHDKTCDFCDYSDICKNRIEIKKREMQDLSNDEVLFRIKEELDAQVDG